MPDYTIGQGDLGPDLVMTLSDANGAYDLTGSTASFHVANRDTKALIINRAVVIDSDQVTHKGRCRYSWQVGDTTVAGDFLAEVEVLVGGTVPITFPDVDSKLTIRIAPALA